MGVGNSKSGRRAKATFVQIGFASLVVIAVALAFAFTQGQATGASATAPQTTRQMTLIGASTIHSTPLGSGAVANPETDSRDGEGDGPGIKPGLGPDVVVRPFATPAASKMPRHRTNLAIPSKFAASPSLCSSSPEHLKQHISAPGTQCPGQLRCRFSGTGICRIQRIEPCRPAIGEWWKSIQP